jgi:hypothetical protein
MDLGHHPKQPAAVHGERRIVDPVAVAERRTHEEQRQQLARPCDQVLDGAFHRIEERVLKEQVLDRVARENELGKDDESRAPVMGFARGAQHRCRIGGRVRQRRSDRAGGDARETVPVDGSERHGVPRNGFTR